MNTRSIKKPEGTLDIITKDGDTFDIINAVCKVVNDPKAMAEVEKFVTDNHLTSSDEHLEQLWKFVHSEIKYVEDGHKQYVQYPSNLIHGKCPTGEKRSGDCKSKTAFIAAVLQVIAQTDETIQAIVIRFCTYEKSNKNVTHVYPMVIRNVNDQGNELIILDAVWHTFNEQKMPMYLKTDKVINYTRVSYQDALKRM